MKIFVINTGSSSFKYQIFEIGKERPIAKGLVEKIGEGLGILNYENDRGLEVKENRHFDDHTTALKAVIDLLTDSTRGVLKSTKEISAIGHRVVHGGEAFKEPTLIDDKVMDAIKKMVPLAPLHNPANIKGIEVAKELFSHAPNVAVFDTAFHQTMPKSAYLYAVPYALYKESNVRRYGFHGTSHSYVAKEAAKFLGKPLESLNMIVLHLGNGCSASAIKGGKSIDTSMGLTPLEGLVMGTRSGDLDPALHFYLASEKGWGIKDLDRVFNKESGMKGICGLNDLREIEEKAEQGDQQAKLALDIYCYRIKKYVGSYMAALGRTDAIIFTAGVGQNSSTVRALSLSNMEEMGITLSLIRNKERAKNSIVISDEKSRIKVLAIPTNEELEIALLTAQVLQK